MADQTNEIGPGTDTLVSVARHLEPEQLRVLVAAARRLRHEQEERK